MEKERKREKSTENRLNHIRTTFVVALLLLPLCNTIYENLKLNWLLEIAISNTEERKKKQENIEKLPHKNGEITFSRHKFAGIERFLFYMNRDKIVRRAYQRQQQANHVNF